MRGGWIVVITVVLLGGTAVDTLVPALAPTLAATNECGDNDDPCPPFSDDCHDCASCAHVAALPAVFVATFPESPPPVLRTAPLPLERPRPVEAPPNEILTVPRA